MHRNWNGVIKEQELNRMSAKHAHIIQALVTNGLIALTKGVAAFFTGSGAMLAEAIHSTADCTNQLILLWGVKSADKPADEHHPLGYGRVMYFWSFMVAIMLFLGGGVFSVYEGMHKYFHPESVSHVWWGLGVLVFALVLEGNATYSNIAELNTRRGGHTFLRYLRMTKDSDLVVVFGENLAATLGLILAVPAVFLSWVYDDGRWDAVGGIAIGVVLLIISWLLAFEIRSLLLGERAEPELEEVVHTVVKRYAEHATLVRLISLQQGPGQVLLMMKFTLQPTLSIEEACDLINRIEDEIRLLQPQVKWCFVEPDRSRR